jgi:hypothetical protein
MAAAKAVSSAASSTACHTASWQGAILLQSMTWLTAGSTWPKLPKTAGLLRRDCPAPAPRQLLAAASTSWCAAWCCVLSSRPPWSSGGQFFPICGLQSRVTTWLMSSSKPAHACSQDDDNSHTMLRHKAMPAIALCGLMPLRVKRSS